ncbi:lipid-A-disaccharide synthase [Inhella crocodyli]|uniref:Lipid-A-disaccharide synthase n=1 Tax=Inhella crocodyli TaxID=2499851 RepID=A0A3S2XVE1_9BURK|nr:lipid-A-disaccharide synthase [Inhella crocodyli]RVT87494.1 lipid-A-disaccharide synthase [Inhella crocodyli]
MGPGLRLGLVAGEASGDLIGSLLLQSLQQRGALSGAMGIGGPRMQALGFEAWWPSERLSVFGFTDALKRLPELLWIRRRLGTRLLRERLDAFVGIDAPDFNFGLERRLRQAGVKTVHYVCPSIWAWRPERVETIRRAADHVLCLFPFEPALLQAAGIAASFVGHPLAEVIPIEPDRAAARGRLGLAEERRVLALLPGSRASEIDLIAPAVLGAAQRLQNSDPGLQLVLPCAPGMSSRLQPLIPAGLANLQVLEGQAHDALAACDVAIVASGTATLEAALFKRPMVIAYRVSPANHRRMKKLQLQPWVGLPNVLAREFLVPECLQDACTPETLAREVQAWFDHPARVATTVTRFHEIHDALRADTAQRTHDAIAQLTRR